MPYRYPVVIHHIIISPAHNYFSHSPQDDEPGSAPTFDVDEVLAEAGRGLVGDRNYAKRNHDGQVSLLSAEVFDALRAHVGNPALSPLPARRNLVIAGAPLNQLIGREFALDFGTHLVRLDGRKHCAPCAWMDRMVAPGALAFLRGRGGLRARVLEGGMILRGPALLRTDFPLDLATITAPLPLPNLPA